MIRHILTFYFFLFIFIHPLYAQNTVGLLSYDPTKAFDGYNLMFPHNQPNVYLLNNCGEIAHTWTDDADFRPGNMAYLLEDGRLVKAKRPSSVVNDPIWAGGGGATVEIRDWDNNLEWSFTINDSLQRLHHDIEPLPNGNILMIVWELKNEQEAIEAGRDTALMVQDKLWPDKIIEVDPTNSEIVWEWHVWDHLIQSYDSTKNNYGVIADHPELINLNWVTNNGHPDWMHTNGIDYNEELDQIIIGVPTFSEAWVIDHSTTTEQAAGHSGGLGNRGGDLMYRWGNPETYDLGTIDDQTLFSAHDIHWVDDHLVTTHPYYGKIAVFNNRVGEDFSTVNVFNPPWDMYKWGYTFGPIFWGPEEFDLTITHPIPTELYSTGLSSVQMLPNNNVLICSGRWGYTFEITPDNEIVWEYKTPLRGGNPVSQGDTLLVNDNLTFRFKRIPSDYPAFEGKDLSPKGWIELNPDSTFCELILSVDDETGTDLVPKQFKLSQNYPNPFNPSTNISYALPTDEFVNLTVYNVLGKTITILVNEQKLAGSYVVSFNASGFPSGVYFYKLIAGNYVSINKMMLLK